MNQLVLITDTLLYRPGDTVTGHVWLDISTTTSGKSLHISLLGTEMCEKLSCGEEKNEIFNNLVADCNHLLWEANSAFPFGSYRTPFEICLPHDLPGSFKCGTLEGWNLEVCYTVKAYVLEDDDLADSDVIIVTQPACCSPTTNPSHEKNRQTFEVRQFLGLSKAQLLLECSVQDTMMKRLHTFSSEIAFHIHIQNTAKTSKIVKRSLKLVQCLTLCGPCVLTESVMYFVTGNNYKNSPTNRPLDSRKSSLTHRPLDRKSSRHDINSNTVKPDYNVAAKSASEWQRILLTETIPDGLDTSVVLDLGQCDRKHKYESSISGRTVKCQYQVILTVTFDDGESFSAQPVDIWIHSHSDTKHMPSNTDKLNLLKRHTMFNDAIAIDESLTKLG